MATTNDSSTWRTWSDHNVQSNILQSDDIVTDRAPHQAAHEAGLERESPYSSSTGKGYGSAVELREYAEGATSAANSGQQPQWVPGSHPASNRPVAPQTTVSRSFRPAADADAEQDARYRSDLPQPRRGAGGPRNPTAAALSSSKSSDLPAPKGSPTSESWRGGATPGPTKPSQSLSGQPRAATSPLASHITSNPSIPRATDSDTSFEPPQGGYGSPQAGVGPPRGANQDKSGSRHVDLSNLPQTPAGQHVRPPPLSKDLPIPGQPLAPQASGVAKTSSSRRPQDTAPGENRERPLPGVAVSPNESRETVPSDTKGSHEPLNRQLTPNDVPPPPVYDSTPTGPPSRLQISPQPPPTTSHAHYYPQTADHSKAPSFSITEHRPHTPPKAVVTPSNSPSLPQVDFSSSEYHGTSGSRDKPETPDYGVVIDKTAVVEPSPALLPPPALLRPTNDIVRGKSSNRSLAGPNMDEGRRPAPRPTGMEARTSSRHAESTSSRDSRKPRMEGSHSAGMSTQGQEALRPQVERGDTMDSLPRAYEMAAMQATPVVEERLSTRTGIEREMPRPRTPPMRQVNVPINDQPIRIERRHPLDHIRNNSNQNLSGSNAAHTHAARPAPAPQEEGGPIARIDGRITDQPVRTPNPHPLDPSRNYSNQALSGGNTAHMRVDQQARAPQVLEEEDGLLEMGRAQQERMPPQMQILPTEEPIKVNVFCCCGIGNSEPNKSPPVRFKNSWDDSTSSHQVLSGGNTARTHAARITPAPQGRSPVADTRPPPRLWTPPVAQSNASIKDQPDRIERPHLSNHNRNNLSRSSSNETLSASNAAHTRAPQPTLALQEGGPIAEERPTANTGTESERSPPTPSRPQTADHSEAPSIAVTEHHLRTPPKVVTRLNNTETPVSEVVLDKTAVVETPPTPSPPALLPPTNNIGKEDLSDSLAGPSVDEGRRSTPKPTGMEAQTSSTHTRSTSEASNRQLVTSDDISSPPTAVHSKAPSLVQVVTGRHPRTPPKVVTRLNSPSLSQVDLYSSLYSHGTNESRNKSETPDSEVVLDKTAVAETSPTPSPPALLPPTNNIGEKASNSSPVGPSVDEGRHSTPKSTGMEPRVSSRHTGSTPSGASRQPRTEGSLSAGMSTQGRKASRSQVERGDTSAYEMAGMKANPSPVTEEKTPASTGIGSERPLPRTPPMAQSDTPIKDQPVRIENRRPSGHTRNDPPRYPLNQTLSDSERSRRTDRQSTELEPVSGYCSSISNCFSNCFSSISDCCSGMSDKCSAFCSRA